MPEQWEYRTERHTEYGGGGEPYFLSYMGDEGWELMGVSIVPHRFKDSDGAEHQYNEERYIFKRRKETT